MLHESSAAASFPDRPIAARPASLTRVENTRSRAGVRQTSGHLLAKLIFWSIRTTVCREAYTHMSIAPGQSFAWKIVYDFYELP